MKSQKKWVRVVLRIAIIIAVFTIVIGAWSAFGKWYVKNYIGHDVAIPNSSPIRRVTKCTDTGYTCNLIMIKTKAEKNEVDTILNEYSLGPSFEHYTSLSDTLSTGHFSIGVEPENADSLIDLLQKEDRFLSVGKTSSVLDPLQ